MKSLHNLLGLSSYPTIISYPRREVKIRKKIRKTSLFVDGCKMRQRIGYTTHSTQVTPPGVSDPYENFDENSWMFMTACWMAAMSTSWMAAAVNQVTSWT